VCVSAYRRSRQAYSGTYWKASLKAVQQMASRCYESAKGLLINEMQDSWFFGSTNPENVRGRFLLFAGGVPLYREIFADVAAKGYEGFELRWLSGAFSSWPLNLIFADKVSRQTGRMRAS
jgi:hypothetical protein